MATAQLVPAGGGQTEQVQLLPSLLSNAFDAVTGTFRSFLDQELGLGEVALAADARLAEARVSAQEAPLQTVGGTALGSNAALLIGGGLALVALVLLLSR